MIEHIWIEDNVDWCNFHSYYKNITVKWRGDVPIEAVATYQGIDTKVRFYTAYQANNHIKYNLWCGLHVQKVLINEVINVDSVLYLVTRLRSEDYPKYLVEHHKEILILEVTKYGVYASWFDDVGVCKLDSLENLLPVNELTDLLYTIM